MPHLAGFQDLHLQKLRKLRAPLDDIGGLKEAVKDMEQGIDTCDLGLILFNYQIAHESIREIGGEIGTVTRPIIMELFDFQDDLLERAKEGIKDCHCRDFK